ncbi:MAG: beta-lactamase family protein [Spirochaetia bacterium]|nr:beta-lactamase family protein [Spirochaetia bacterium]
MKRIRQIRFISALVLTGIFVIPGFDGTGFSHQVESVPTVELLMQEVPAPSEWARRRLNNVAAAMQGFLNDRTGTPSVPTAFVSVHSVVSPTPILEAKEAMDRNTTMSLASLTKPLTATGVLILVDQGRLRLDDPISRYIPEFKMERRDLNSPLITVRHLLQQTSGIPYAGRSATVPSGIEGFFMPKQMYPAGSHHEYSNSNYELLSLLIERVTGQKYAEYMQEALFEPLHMTHSRAGFGFSGASGVQSSASDLSNFARMLLSWGKFENKQILSADLIREMFMPPPHIPVSQNMSYYAMGWKVNVAKGRVVEAYHPGVWFHILTDLRIFPAKKMFFVILSNPPVYKSDAATEFLGYATGNARRVVSYMGSPEDLETMRVTQPDQGQLSAYSGQYMNSDGVLLEIQVQGRNLVRKINRDLRLLSPISDYEFGGDGNAIPHEFVYRNGQLAGLSTPGGYYERRMPR